MKYFTQFCLVFLAIFLSIQTLNAQIKPKKDGNNYSLTVGNVSLIVDASYGARITSFKLGEKELLIQGKGMVGSTLWTSPQKEWGWPTLQTTDLNPYAASIEGNRMIFTSGEEKGLSGKKFKFIKSFWANENNNSISIRYSMVNTGTSAISNALWSVTRVKPEGLTFWKVGDIEPWGSTLTNHIDNLNEYYWLQFEESNGKQMKFFSDIGSTGWFGHIAEGNVLFLKKFDDVPSADFAPGESEFEYWVDGSFGYIELENQSKYSKIESGDTLHYEVFWHVHQLPDNIKVEKGNLELVNYVEQVVLKDIGANIEMAVLKQAKVYPNPAQNRINIRTNSEDQSLFQLFSITGSLVMSETIQQNSDLNISDLKKGVYFYRILSNEKEVKGKLIKH